MLNPLIVAAVAGFGIPLVLVLYATHKVWVREIDKQTPDPFTANGLIWPEAEECDREPGDGYNANVEALCSGVSAALPMTTTAYWNENPVSEEEIAALKELGLESEVKYVHTLTPQKPRKMYL